MPAQVRRVLLMRRITSTGNEKATLHQQCNQRPLSTAVEPEPATAPATPATGYTLRQLKPFGDIPGPLALPFLGHAAYVLPRIGEFHHTIGTGASLERLQSRYGDLVRLGRSIRRRPALFVFDPELMAQVYNSGSTEPPKFEKSPLSVFRDQFRTASLVPGDDSDEKVVFKVTKSLLLDNSILDQYAGAFEDIATAATQRIGELQGKDEELNAQIEQILYSWAMENIGCIVLGYRLNALDSSVPALTAQLINITRHIFTRGYQIRSEATLRPHSPHFQDAVFSYETYHSLCTQIIEKSLRESEQCGERHEKAFLKKLQLLGKEHQASLAADILLSGVDTVVHTTIRLLYYLSLNPAKQQKLQDELEFSQAGSEESEKRMYLGACVREALRLHPVTGGVVRRTKSDVEIAGYLIPAGVDIVLAHHAASVSEKQFGRARSFVPERWTCEPGEPLHAAHAHPAASCPFGGGANACPGRELARRSVEALISKLMLRFRMEWHGPRSELVFAPLNHMPAPHYFSLQRV